jgi:hypothetical protein
MPDEQKPAKGVVVTNTPIIVKVKGGKVSGEKREKGWGESK